MWVYYLFPPFSLSFFWVTLAGFSTFLLVSDIAYKKWKRLLMKSPSSRDGSLSLSSSRQMESGWGVKLRAWTHSGRYEAQLPLGPGPQASQRAHGAHGAPSPSDLPKRVLDSDLYLSTKTAERFFSSPEGFLISLLTFQPMQLQNLATTLTESWSCIWDSLSLHSSPWAHWMRGQVLFLRAAMSHSGTAWTPAHWEAQTQECPGLSAQLLILACLFSQLPPVLIVSPPLRRFQTGLVRVFHALPLFLTSWVCLKLLSLTQKQKSRLYIFQSAFTTIVNLPLINLWGKTGQYLFPWSLGGQLASYGLQAKSSPLPVFVSFYWNTASSPSLPRTASPSPLSTCARLYCPKSPNIYYLSLYRKSLSDSDTFSDFQTNFREKTAFKVSGLYASHLITCFISQWFITAIF